MSRDTIKVPATSGSGSVTLFLNSMEFYGDGKGCKYRCWSLTTDIIGFGGVIPLKSSKSGSAFTGYWGAGKNASIAVDLAGNVNGNVGWAIGGVYAGFGGSWRMVCWKMTDSDDNGCPCSDNPPVATFGVH